MPSKQDQEYLQSVEKVMASLSGDAKKGDSKEYRDVLDSIRNYAGACQRDINEGNLEALKQSTDKMKTACEAYLGKRTFGFTASGRERRKNVESLLDFSKDLDFSGANMKNKNFRDVVADSRTVKIDLSGQNPRTTADEYGTYIDMGDMAFHKDASTPSWNSGKQTSEDAPAEETFDDTVKDNAKKADVPKAEMPEFLKIIDMILTVMFPLEKMLLMTAISLFDKFNEEQVEKHDPEVLNEFANRGVKIPQKFAGPVMDTFANTMQSARMLQDAKNAGIGYGRNVADRSVASSKLSNMLGQGDLYTRSRFAEVKKDGVTMKGVISDAAKGYDIKLKEGADKVAGLFDKDQPVRMTADCKKQLANLQVMDLLAGQVGRHQEALSYDIQPGKDGKPELRGVQGIGNQWGFGFSQLQTPDQIGKRVPDHDTRNLGNLTDLKYIAKDMWKSLQALKPEDLQSAMGGILSADELKAMEGRLSTMKSVLGARIDSKDLTVVDDWKQLDGITPEGKYFDTVSRAIDQKALERGLTTQKDLAERDAKLKAEREAKARTEAEAKAKAEKEAQEKAEAEAKAKAEREAKAKAEKEAKEKAEREAKEAKAKEEEAKAKEEEAKEDTKEEEAKETKEDTKEEETKEEESKEEAKEEETKEEESKEEAKEKESKSDEDFTPEEEKLLDELEGKAEPQKISPEEEEMLKELDEKKEEKEPTLDDMQDLEAKAAEELANQPKDDLTRRMEEVTERLTSLNPLTDEQTKKANEELDEIGKEKKDTQVEQNRRRVSKIGMGETRPDARKLRAEAAKKKAEARDAARKEYEEACAEVDKKQKELKDLTKQTKEQNKKEIDECNEAKNRAKDAIKKYKKTKSPEAEKEKDKAQKEYDEKLKTLKANVDKRKKELAQKMVEVKEAAKKADAKAKKCKQLAASAKTEGEKSQTQKRKGGMQRR